MDETPFADVRLAVRADRSDLLSLFGARAPTCAVGPAEPDGWVAVRMAADTDPGPVAGEMSTAFEAPVVVTGVDEDGERLGLWIWRHGAAVVGRPWSPRPGGELGSAQAPRGETTRETAQQAAAALGRSDTEAGLVDLLRAEHDLDADQRLTAVVGLLGLPERLMNPDPAAAVVLHRGERAVARLAASIAGPAWLVPLGGGWTLLAPAEAQWRDSLALATSVSSTGGRRAPVLLLWRDREECGYLLWQRGSPVDSHAWNSPWELTAPATDTAEELAPPHGDAARLTAAARRRRPDACPAPPARPPGRPARRAG